MKKKSIRYLICRHRFCRCCVVECEKRRIANVFNGVIALDWLKGILIEQSPRIVFGLLRLLLTRRQAKEVKVILERAFSLRCASAAARECQRIGIAIAAKAVDAHAVAARSRCERWRAGWAKINQRNCPTVTQ